MDPTALKYVTAITMVYAIQLAEGVVAHLASTEKAASLNARLERGDSTVLSNVTVKMDTAIAWMVPASVSKVLKERTAMKENARVEDGVLIVPTNAVVKKEWSVTLKRASAGAYLRMKIVPFRLKNFSKSKLWRRKMVEKLIFGK